MCCDTTACRAPDERCRFVFRASIVVPHAASVTSQLGETMTAVRDVEASKTSPQERQSSQVKVNPVWQCARPWASARGEAQASPLFSDHAPREVHLWQ